MAPHMAGQEHTAASKQQGGGSVHTNHAPDLPARGSRRRYERRLASACPTRNTLGHSPGGHPHPEER
ncbi:Hypothetical predicted protein, partial [Pelobates cultripes]